MIPQMRHVIMRKTQRTDNVLRNVSFCAQHGKGATSRNRTHGCGFAVGLKRVGVGGDAGERADIYKLLIEDSRMTLAKYDLCNPALSVQTHQNAKGDYWSPFLGEGVKM